MPDSVDYIIVGQGLAGSALAMHLFSMKKKFVVIDNPSGNRATVVAAGLFNPLTGKEIKKTWEADSIFPYLHEFYQSCERITGKKFFFQVPIYRPFLSVEEQNEWMAKSNEVIFKGYVKEIFTKPEYKEVKNSYGGILLNHSGYLDTNAYIQAVREFLKTQNAFRQEEFTENEIQFENETVVYQNLPVKAILFCQGTYSLSSKYWKWMPIRSMKGETLKIKLASGLKIIPNRGVYVVPSSDGSMVGATYNYHDKSESITNDAKIELTEKLRDLLNLEFEIVNQKWGLRPTTPDRRPMLGRHPEINQFVIFNGLGTKGVSLAPYMAKTLINYLEKGIVINKAVDISRYYSLYSRFVS